MGLAGIPREQTLDRLKPPVFRGAFWTTDFPPSALPASLGCDALVLSDLASPGPPSESVVALLSGYSRALAIDGPLDERVDRSCFDPGLFRHKADTE